MLEQIARMATWLFWLFRFPDHIKCSALLSARNSHRTWIMYICSWTTMLISFPSRLWSFWSTSCSPLRCPSVPSLHKKKINKNMLQNFIAMITVTLYRRSAFCLLSITKWTSIDSLHCFFRFIYSKCFFLTQEMLTVYGLHLFIISI